MAYYLPNGELIVPSNPNNQLMQWFKHEEAVNELRKEGYGVHKSVRELFTTGCDIDEMKNTIRAILDDKTGFTASMYGINLEDE